MQTIKINNKIVKLIFESTNETITIPSYYLLEILKVKLNAKDPFCSIRL